MKWFKIAVPAALLALLVTACKVSQPLTTVPKAGAAPEIKLMRDSAFEVGNLFADSIGESIGGFGLTGTGQGGGGVSEYSLGMSSISTGFGTGAKKNSATAKQTKDRSAGDREKKATSEKASRSGVPTGELKLNDQSKVDKLIGFKAAPRRELAAAEIGNVKRETVQAGTHPKEMPPGSYAVAEKFDTEEAANRYAARLVKLGFDPNMPRYVSASQKWYVCLQGPSRPSQTRDKISELSSLEIFEGMWQLVVE